VRDHFPIEDGKIFPILLSFQKNLLCVTMFIMRVKNLVLMASLAPWVPCLSVGICQSGFSINLSIFKNKIKFINALKKLFLLDIFFLGKSLNCNWG
jgi:hypothetical protein